MSRIGRRTARKVCPRCTGAEGARPLPVLVGERNNRRRGHPRSLRQRRDSSGQIADNYRDVHRPVVCHETVQRWQWLVATEASTTSSEPDEQHERDCGGRRRRNCVR